MNYEAKLQTLKCFNLLKKIIDLFIQYIWKRITRAVNRVICIRNNIWHLHSLSIDENHGYV